MCALGRHVAGPGKIGTSCSHPGSATLPSEDASSSQGAEQRNRAPWKPRCPVWTRLPGPTPPGSEPALAPRTHWAGLPSLGWPSSGAWGVLTVQAADGSRPVLVQNGGSLELSRLGCLLNLLSKRRKVLAHSVSTVKHVRVG